MQVKNSVAQAWFAAAGKSLATVQNQINAATQPASFAFPESLHLTIDVEHRNHAATVNNVLAYLPGKTDEYIILGAHYDHLGYGNYDSLAPSQIGQIHPGADDNASGTAGLLELARLLAPLKGQLQRGILFASFAGEELGLLGSAEWVKEPTRPLGQAVAMLNMDMIGRIKDEKVYIGGVGTGSTFQSILAAADKDSGFHIETSVGGYASSDHTSFVAKKIPVLFFFSGLHSDYHKPSDTWDKINAPDAARLLDLVGKITLRLDAATGGRLLSPWLRIRIRTRASRVVGAATDRTSARFRISASRKTACASATCKPGSPAAKAGLKAGDVLVRFGDKPIMNLYDFTDALRAAKSVRSWKSPCSATASR